MKLAISLSEDNGKCILHLTEEKSSFFKLVISHDGIPELLDEPWIFLLKINDSAELIKNLTPNQLIVLLYFFLVPYTPPLLIMKRWFSDVDCEPVISDYLADLLIKSRISEEYDTDCFFENCSKHLPTQKILSFNDMNIINKQNWNFIWNIEPDSKSNQLTYIRESHFIIEDHSSLIIGFSNSYTSFLELLSGYNPILFDSLCSLVPLQSRDIMTLGQTLIEIIEIEDVLRKLFPKGIEFYGINQEGLLINYSNIESIGGRSDLSLRSKMMIISEITSIIPLFIKLIK